MKNQSIKFKTNQNLTKGPRTKIRNQRKMIEFDILINKRTTMNFWIASAIFQGRREKSKG